MWEAIAANRRRSILLIGLMGMVLITFGACVGMYIGSTIPGVVLNGPDPEKVLLGAAFGGGGAMLLWLGLWIGAVYQGDRYLLGMTGAREITKLDYPRLWNVVEEMTIAAGLPNIPRVYIIEESAPNAFAVGRKPETAAVAVTSGLLRLLNRDELQGVVAHEIGHIKNLDIQFMTIAAVTAGAVEALSRGVLRGGAHSGGRRSGGGRGKGNAYLLAIVFILAILSPILVRLLYLACSRQREYLADASAARFTRFPDGLASALEKIAAQAEWMDSKRVTGALAPLYIINPLQAAASGGWLSTHPPMETRVKVLRSMGGRAGYVDYEAALRKIEGQAAALETLESAAKSEASVLARLPFAEPSTEEGASPDTPVGRARQVADLLDRFALYTVVGCACGMRIKAPPDFQQNEILCPRCGRYNSLPKAEPVAQKTLPAVEDTGDKTLQYKRSQDGWDSFRCACGQTIQIGPGFPLDHTVCGKCDRRIELRRSG